ncbi:conserved hypothetical protein [Neospora caninum Liverpool]|uniref:Uncharacterized protein n=1 Tax=Neospora caninum (strain Liverpool) TaxID=572307 RepID=F0V8I4_NEOCL|nr:conserved hypothetical protein [Neospora caninum Liverpool]CBZ50025.1 conserved hypothetical protein [Neospora caninum Liverpool]CEL64615.1 TPA: hypothetical protein BN1204_005010 [Neospora caninum Liverpool]|eukprot:XP_003880060.1 conserved hypothetical protein [Neospora caninum Liverpool]
MEWIRGGPAAEVVFQIQQTKFVIPPEVMNRSDVQGSGLALIAKNEGFKDIPPKLPKAEDGSIRLTRPLEGFELLVDHLLDLEPLRNVPLQDFASKYIALKSEMAFWQLPLEDLPFNDKVYFESAWTDERCLFPLSAPDAAALEKHADAEPTSGRRTVLTRLEKQPEEISKTFLDLGEEEARDWSFFAVEPAEVAKVARKTHKPVPGRLVLAVGPKKFFCKIPYVTDLCVHYGTLGEPEAGFAPFALLVSPTECTIVWSLGCFIHIKAAEGSNPLSAHINVIKETPSWLCVHPCLDYVLSGVKGPVPYIFCFDMPDASAVRFFPWGCLVVNKQVTLESRKKPSDISGPSASALVARLASRDESGPNEHLRRLFTFLQPDASARKRAEDPSELNPAKPVLVASVLRSKLKALKPIERIHLINMDIEEESSVTLRHGEHYDILDVRNAAGTDFEVVMAVNGGIVSRKREDFMEVRYGEPVAVVGVTGKGHLVPQGHLLIPNGAPVGEMFRSLTLVSEYIISEKTYYTFGLAQKLFEFHRSLYLGRPGSDAGGDAILSRKGSKA